MSLVIDGRSTSGQIVLLADRTNGRAIGTVLRPSVVVVVCLSVCLYGMYCG